MRMIVTAFASVAAAALLSTPAFAAEPEPTISTSVGVDQLGDGVKGLTDKLGNALACLDKTEGGAVGLVVQTLTGNGTPGATLDCVLDEVGAGADALLDSTDAATASVTATVGDVTTKVTDTVTDTAEQVTGAVTK